MVAHLVIVAHLDCFVLSNVEDVELEESPNTIVVNPSHLAEPGPESDLLDLGVPTQERISSASMFVSSKKSAIFPLKVTQKVSQKMRRMETITILMTLKHRDT